MMQDLIEIAKQRYDGHFTIMRFTKNWRVCFGTVDNETEIGGMTAGKTLEEAIAQAVLIEQNDPGKWYERLRQAGDAEQNYRNALYAQAVAQRGRE